MNPAVSSAAATPPLHRAECPPANGRLHLTPPVAVIDIGSNSVRLVIYEALSRAPTPLFNEKVMCGLGKQVATTGELLPEAMDKALRALSRFRALCDVMGVQDIHAVATAAARDAHNGDAFIRQAEELCKVEIDVLSGRREAEFAALGIISGIHQPHGIVGDLGGGSLELTQIHGSTILDGKTWPLGVLAIQDKSGKSISKAEKLVKKTLGESSVLSQHGGRPFYAVGGTWRALAKLHMFQRGYPLHVMHGYHIPADEALDFARMVARTDPDSLSRIDVISSSRRPLLAYGAIVLEHILRLMRPSQVVISALGVREGLLYSRLEDEDKSTDPLIVACQDLNQLRSRAPQHGYDLIAWTDRLFSLLDIEEKPDETRLRHAACLLADIGWRAHPDYRGEQSVNIISNAAFIGIDHPGRAFLALAVYFRHAGLSGDDVSPTLRELASTRLMERARLLGAAMRVAYMISASMPDILPRVPLSLRGRRLTLDLPADLKGLAGDRLMSRLKTLAKLSGYEPLVDSSA